MRICIVGLGGDVPFAEELRKAVALTGVPWTYLRFTKGKDGNWRVSGYYIR